MGKRLLPCKPISFRITNDRGMYALKIFISKTEVENDLGFAYAAITRRKEKLSGSNRSYKAA